MSFIESNRPEPIRLAVFKLGPPVAEISPVIVADREEPYGIFERVRNIKAVLHPVQPLLAFAIGQTVSVWDFDTG
jgi:hypothetical protein